MDYILGLVVVIVFFAFINGTQGSGFSIGQTKTINGIFVLLVFMSHYYNYFKDSIDCIVYPYFQIAHGQLVVVPFFLFSGYGIMASIQNKNYSYVKSIITEKAVLLLVHFDICVFLFVILNFLIGIHYSPMRIALAFTSVVEIGNSNWFIAVTLIIYCIVGISFTIFKNSHARAIGMTTTVLLLYVIMCIYLAIPSRFYNTAIAFPVGMALRSILGDSTKRIEKGGKLITFIVFLLSFVPLLFSINVESPVLQLVATTIRVLLFSLFLLLLLNQISLHSKVLSFFGSHVFSIYMLQRIPMIVIKQYGLHSSSGVLLITLIITIIISLAMERVFAFIDRLFFRIKEKCNNYSRV